MQGERSEALQIPDEMVLSGGGKASSASPCKSPDKCSGKTLFRTTGFYQQNSKSTLKTTLIT